MTHVTFRLTAKERDQLRNPIYAQQSSTDYFSLFSYRRRFLEEILASNVSCVATLDGRGGDRPGQSSAGAGVPRALIVIGRNDCTDRDGLAN